MIGFTIWLRRGTAFLAFPAMVIIQILMMRSRSGWHYEWDWAFNVAASSAVLLGPLVAGIVAFDRSRRFEPTFSLLATGAVRGGRSVLFLPLSAWAWVLVTWLLGVAFAAVRADRGGAVGDADPWIFLEVPVLLMMAACVGLAIGSHVRSLVAGPAASIMMFLGGAYLGNLGLGLAGALRTADPTGSRMVMDRNPSMAMALIFFHLGVAAVALIIAAIQPAATRHFRRALFAAGAAIVIAALPLASVSRTEEPYEWTDDPVLCVGETVEVCGPERGEPLLRRASASLASAVRSLKGSGIEWQDSYVMVAGRAVSPDVGVLSAQPENIEGDALGVGDVASTLAMPRLCRDLFGNVPPMELMDAQGVVMNWVGQALAAPARPGPAPQDVRSAYELLRTCDPMTDPPR